jgi:c-di-GMP-binding flagellar brake protein YcgR
MREQDILRSEAVCDLLNALAQKRVGAVMTHVSRGKWHMTKVEITDATPTTIQLEIPHREKHHPVNIQVDQPVGLSFKHNYCKYIFESTVIGFEASVNNASGGVIVIQLPDKIERLQRRNFYRVMVPQDLNVRAIFWHRAYNDDNRQAPMENYWQAKLIDVSAGGLQLAMDASQKSNFRPGQLVGLQFTPLPYEKPILLECQLRHIAPTADGSSICLGLQIIGLEATYEGRETLHKLCDVVKTYFNMNNKSNAAQPSNVLEM